MRRRLLDWYEHHGRADLPWRRRRSAYRTLVSEFMLQQTQASRVALTFERFVRSFPNLRALAAASPGDVLREWKGLGYNSRAVRLHAVAVAIVERHGGRVPRSIESLRRLPGIGPYTAAAIRAFAFDLDDVPVDVNIGRVLHRLGYSPEIFGPGGSAIASALMDLGAQVCTARAPGCERCPLERWCQKRPLPARRAGSSDGIPFSKTTRYARGRIVDRLRALPPGKQISLLDLHRDLSALLPGRDARNVGAVVRQLAREGVVALDGDDVALP